jgi:hypothetical protein
LVVGASNIVVNLNGHSVVCTGSTPVGVQVDNRTRVAVLFGQVTGGCDQAGVRFLDGGRNLAMGVTADGHNSGFFTAGTTVGNRLLFNRASFDSYGLVLQGTNNRVEGNVFTRNIQAVIVQAAQQNVIARNWVVKNANDGGIFVENGSTANRVVANVALQNTTRDLEDGNANCDANLWLFNFFTTANQPCIH